MSENKEIIELIQQQIFRFMPNACNICKKVESKNETVYYVEKLYRCSRCQIVCYCSSEHQQKDYQRHQNFCKAAKLLGDKLKFSPKFTYKENLIIHMKMFEQLLLRELSYYEKDLVLFRKKCHKCHRIDNSVMKCQICHITSFCPQHKDAEHDCTKALKALQCEQVIYIQGLPPCWVPNTIVEKTEEIPKEWNQYFLWRQASNLSVISKILFAEALSIPLSLALGIETLQIQNQELIEIHLIGCNIIYEILSLGKYEEIFHLFPNLKKLEIVFYGKNLAPDIDQIELCENCKKNRKMKLSVVDKEYHESKIEISPDFCFSFNPSFDSEPEDWSKNIPKIVDMNVPTFITTMNEDESKEFGMFIQEFGGNIIIPSFINPFQGTQPFREPFEENRFYYKNQYILCFKGN